MSDEWVEVGEPETPVDTPPLESIDENGPPAHDGDGDASEQGGEQGADVEPVPDTDAEGRPFAGPDS
jgi:hypothetical protein